MNERDSDYDEFFQDLDQVIEVISDLNPNNIIGILECMITKLGYHNRQVLEEELLHKVYEKVARISGIDFETIVKTMKDKIRII